MMMSFCPKVLVDFVNRWWALKQPAGRTTIKGILQSQLFSTVLTNNTYSKSGAYGYENSTERIIFSQKDSILRELYKNTYILNMTVVTADGGDAA